MTALAVAGPLAAAVLIVALRRGAAALALLGAGVGLLGAAVGLSGVAVGARYAAEIPGLPGLPLRLVAEPLSASLAMTRISLFVSGYCACRRSEIAVRSAWARSRDTSAFNRAIARKLLPRR